MATCMSCGSISCGVQSRFTSESPIRPVRYPRRSAVNLNWREGCAADELLSSPPFERAGKAPGRQSTIYALRLGNTRYPHMKLQIQPWPNDAGFMLSVNTHDQVAGINLSDVDAQNFRELQSENQRLKEAIEQAWDDGGLPTFLRYLRDYIESRRDDTATGGREQGTDTRPEMGPMP